MAEEIFYHVVTERQLLPGQTINFDSQKSGVYQRVIEKEKIVLDIYNHPNKYIESNLDHHTKVALRELALEEVRKEKFPNYPSRLKSLYVSKSIKEAQMWADSFITQGRKVFAIVTVRTDGNSFTGDAYNCFEGTINHNINLSLAHKYWNNEINLSQKEPIYETIIDGNITVIRTIKNYEKIWYKINNYTFK